jgi:hypothetical protein
MLGTSEASSDVGLILHILLQKLYVRYETSTFGLSNIGGHERLDRRTAADSALDSIVDAN